ncbi:MAG TPA: nucleoside kinase [bacterium]|nr:nucleoside kinase [bacterium]
MINVEVMLPGAEPVALEVERGTPIQRVLVGLPAPEPPWLMAFSDHHARDLREPLEKGCRLSPRNIADHEGIRAFRRGVRLLLIRAAAELFPETYVYIDHSLSGGFFGELRRADASDCSVPVTPDMVEELKRRMDELVATDEEIVREVMPRKAVIAELRAKGDATKVQLLEHYPRDEIVVYRFGGVLDSFYGPVAPRSGLLKPFGLVYYPPGFVLRFPTSARPDALAPFTEQRKLFHIFHEFSDWIKVLGAETVGGLNRVIAEGDAKELVLLSEALHEKKVAEIADEICSRSPVPRLILVAGPSSSGKTTFTQRLTLQLTINGHRPVAVGVDDYFIPRERTPLDEEGRPDFERLEAIDVGALNGDLSALMRGEEIHPPRFDFKAGRSARLAETLRVGPETPLIVEGIHALNDALTPEIPAAEKFKVYVSCLTQLNIDNHNRVPTTDTRLVRRLVRDARFRGYDALETLRRWHQVRRGEDRYIFPFQETADVMFNSALVYELSVLGKYARPLLERVPEGEPEGAEAERLLQFIAFFLDLPDKMVPSTSLLREFIGGSDFRRE